MAQTPGEYAVETQDLTKEYGKKTALDHLNLKVRGGQILVILGPNGSGKTTFLHLISTVLKPSHGTASVMGFDIVRDPLKVRQLSAISFQDPRGFWRHKPSHILSFHASMYGVGSEERKKVVKETLKEFDLEGSKDTRFMHLSGGQAKRLEVAKLFVYKPKLAIFDEPTTMVDLDGKRMVWDKIRELKNDNKSTVIVATNEVREAEYLADQITIFGRGRDIVTDSLDNLKDTVKGGDVVDLEFAFKIEPPLLDALRTIPGTDDLAILETNHVRVRVNRSEDWLPIMTENMHRVGAKISSIRVTEPSLDDVFMKYTSEIVSG
jgi:ABC-2 type transport system ATP-binding protein